jgi:hypothetical protein
MSVRWVLGVLALLWLALALSGCSGLAQLGGADAGKAFCGQLSANNPLATAPAAPVGQMTFSAPGGTRVALCTW